MESKHLDVNGNYFVERDSHPSSVRAMRNQQSVSSTATNIDTFGYAKRFDTAGNSTDNYQHVLKRLEYLEGKLRSLNPAVDQHDTIISSEIRVNGSISHHDAVPEPQRRRQSFRSGTERERQFSVDTEIVNVKSEEWYKHRHRWNPEINEATLVVSMQQSTRKSLAIPSDDTLVPSRLPRLANDTVTQINHTADFPVPHKIDTTFLDREADRVAIACPILINEIAAITSTSLSQSANVILSPFKILVTFQDEFQQKLEERTKLLEDQTANFTKTKAMLKDNTSTIEISSSRETSTGTDRIHFMTSKDSETNAEEDESYDEQVLEDIEEEMKITKKAMDGLRCILHFSTFYLRDIMALRAQIKSKVIETIEFQQLWHLFEPGDLIISSDLRQAYRVLHVTGGRVLRHKSLGQSKKKFSLRPRFSNFVLDCLYIDCDGNEFGAAPKKIVINPFGGERAVHNLKVFPFAMAPKHEIIEDRLLKSGKKFERLARVAHMKYSGLSIPEGDMKREEIDSDVIIDLALAYRNGGKHNCKPSEDANNSAENESSEYRISPPHLDGEVIEEPTPADSREFMDPAGSCHVVNCKACGENTNIYPDHQFDLRRRSLFLNDTELLHRHSVLKSEQDNSETGFDRDQLILLPFRVLGYVLLSRQWHPLDINLVQEIRDPLSSGRDGFDDLVLPEGHKVIVRALVKTHARGAQQALNPYQDNIQAPQGMDLVKGKGRGLIILLHGVPGVGKTSTAECVAMKTNRPLLPITCGDIGTTAKEVEENLEGYFELARKWGCVLLLDEADVFLGERTKGDIVQNSLVSVFLRVLEYYSGILILTTNRVGQLDEAIKSRIHIPLYYPPLDYKTTLKIWDMNIKRLDDLNNSRPRGLEIVYNKKDIKQFAKDHWKDAKNSTSKHHWNGRQIKNAFQTAIALAEWDALEMQAISKKKDKPVQPTLLDRHFKTVSEASARFDHYLTSVKGSDLQNAWVKKIRKDNLGDSAEQAKSGIKYPPASAKKSKGGRKSGQGRGSNSDSDDDNSAKNSDSSKSSDSSTDSSGEDWKQKKSKAEAKKRKLEMKKKEEEDAAKRERKLQRHAQKEAEKLAREAKPESTDSSDSSD